MLRSENLSVFHAFSSVGATSSLIALSLMIVKFERWMVSEKDIMDT